MTKSAPAQTAFGPMVIVAMEQHEPAGQRLIDDELAARLLPKGMSRLVSACRWKPLRNLFIRMSESAAPGGWGGILCRKRYMDEALKDAIASGFDSVVILGAGFDTRIYRYALPAGISSFEVDLPENIAQKRRALIAALGDVPGGVALVPIDFERADLGETLKAQGFRIEGRTLFIWEGVTQYLSEAAVRRTLGFLSAAGAGSRLAFTFVLKDFIDGVDFHGAERLYRRFVEGYRIWLHGIAPEAMSGLLSEYGWRELEQVGTEGYKERYLRPGGRDLAAMDIERACLAEKPS
jgi:methyltransferase (TIGR00027 family)